MHDPTDYSRALLPDLHYGQVRKKSRPAKGDDKDDIDDDAPAEQWVIDILGFDPKGI